MEEKQLYHFKREKYGQGSYATSEHTFICEDGARWDSVLLQFATFLDECGYVGVCESVSLMLEED